MGHANLSNLSDMFINLLYAKGKLTINQAVETAGMRSETLHASEGEYDAESGMVGQAFQELIQFLIAPTQKEAIQNWGWDVGEDGKWKGPYIEPVLSAKQMKPTYLGFVIKKHIANLVSRCDEPTERFNVELHKVTSDAIREWDEKSEAWADYVRELPEMRRVYELFRDDLDDFWNGNDLWLVLDKIPWRFCSGKRVEYRETPRLGNVTH